ncbi:MAG: tyrosine-type recombinase/integrase [Pseudomonadota bacterium]
MTKTKLSHYHARSLLFPAAFPSADSAMRARLALRRIYEALEQSPDAIETEDLVALYEESVPKDQRPTKWRDDLVVLRHLEATSVPSAEMAERVWLGKAHLGDAIAASEQQPWGSEVQRVVGALKRLARLQGKAPEHIPAVESAIQEMLSTYSGANFGVAMSSYPTLKSRILRGVRLVDASQRSRFSYRSLQGPWRQLTDKARAQEYLRGDFAKLWSLITFCWQRDIAPEDVDDHVVSAWRGHLETQLTDTAFETARAAIYSWERMQREVPNWPNQTLSRLYRTPGERRGLRYKDLPGELRDIWENYEHQISENLSPVRASECVCDDMDEDPFADIDETGAATDVEPIRYAYSTLRRQRSAWVRCVEAWRTLHDSDPARLSDVTTKAVLTEVIRNIDVHNTSNDPAQRQKSGARKNLIVDALAWARHDGREGEHIQMLANMRDRVDPLFKGFKRKSDGRIVRDYRDKEMGPRHRERLRQFNNSLNLVNWYYLPDELVAKSRKRLSRTSNEPQAANLAMIALVHRILRCAPIRAANVSALTIGGPNPQISFPRFVRGKGYICLEAWQVKNERDHTVELDEPTMTLLRWWLDEIRPGLMKRVGADPDNPYLFPAGGMAHRKSTHLSKVFTKTNRKEANLMLNVHLCRHLTAKLILDIDPSQMSLVQHLLGHKKLSTTEAYYAEVNSIIAQREWQKILTLAMGQAKHMMKRAA